MPTGLYRPLNSLSHSPKQSRRDRKSVASALAGLASRRRHASYRRTSYRMSSRAGRVLDDGDQSDGDSVRTAAEQERARRYSARQHGGALHIAAGGGGHPRRPPPVGDDDGDDCASSTCTPQGGDGSAPAAPALTSGSMIVAIDESQSCAFETNFSHEFPEAGNVPEEGFPDEEFPVEEFPVEEFPNEELEFEDEEFPNEEFHEQEFEFREEEFPDDESPPSARSKKLPAEQKAQPRNLQASIPAQPMELHVSQAKKRLRVTQLALSPEESAIEQEERQGEPNATTRAGNEALLFVYGENPDLYSDVFQVSHDAIDERIDESYGEQVEQLTLAMDAVDCSDTDHQRRMAMLCGMKPHHLGLLHPRLFLEIKIDAVERAYEILRGGVSRAEYDGLFMEFSGCFGGETRTAATETLTDTSDDAVAAEGEFWDEVGRYANGGCYEGGDMVFGSHGDYSYNCAEDDSGGHKGYGSGNMKTAEGLSSHFDENVDRTGQVEGEGRCSDRHHAKGGDNGKSETRDLDYSYLTREEYEDDDDSDEFGEGRFAGLTVISSWNGRLNENDVRSGASPRALDDAKNDKKEQLYSPRDPIEFDELVWGHSSPIREYIDPLPSPHLDQGDVGKERGGVIDPFVLYGSRSRSRSPLRSNSFREEPISEEDEASAMDLKRPESVAESATSVAFVCKLPSRALVGVEEGKLTMGDVIDMDKEAAAGIIGTNEAMLDMSVGLVVSDLDSVNLGSASTRESASTRGSTSTRDSSSAMSDAAAESLALSRSAGPPRRRGGVRSRLCRMIAAVSSSGSGRSGGTSVSSLEKDTRKQEVHFDGGSVVSQLTDDAAGTEGSMADSDDLSDEIDKEDELGSLDPNDDDCGNSELNEMMKKKEVDRLDCSGSNSGGHGKAAELEAEKPYPPKDEARRTGFDPKGPNMSDWSESEIAEIETLLCIAKNFSNMERKEKNETDQVVEGRRTGLLRSKQKMKHGTKGNEEDRHENKFEGMPTTSSKHRNGADSFACARDRDTIDCFPVNAHEGYTVRFKIDEDDESSGDSRGHGCNTVTDCLGVCVDSVGETIVMCCCC